ncbi:hypothetical protein MC885_011381, partial [Smutsia gigantea]
KSNPTAKLGSRPEHRVGQGTYQEYFLGVGEPEALQQKVTFWPDSRTRDSGSFTRHSPSLVRTTVTTAEVEPLAWAWPTPAKKPSIWALTLAWLLAQTPGIRKVPCSSLMATVPGPASPTWTRSPRTLLRLHGTPRTRIPSAAGAAAEA